MGLFVERNNESQEQGNPSVNAILKLDRGNILYACKLGLISSVFVRVNIPRERTGRGFVCAYRVGRTDCTDWKIIIEFSADWRANRFKSFSDTAKNGYLPVVGTVVIEKPRWIEECAWFFMASIYLRIKIFPWIST